jgi:hypothetical protein
VNPHLPNCPPENENENENDKKYDESTFPQRMLDYVFTNSDFSSDQLVMKSPYHTRKLLFVSHNHSNAPSCGSCYSDLNIRYNKGYIKGSITIGSCDKCKSKGGIGECQIVYLTKTGSVMEIN